MALDWQRERAHWPHAERSRFVHAGVWHWHVQHWHDAPRAARPSVLLLHGTGASAHSWRHLAPLLAAHHEVIAPDLPGHAFTRGSGAVTLPAVATAVAALVQALGRPVHRIVGHSAGAAIALQCVLDGLLAPRDLVSINGAILPLRGPAWPWFSPLARLLAANPLVPQAFAWHATLPFVLPRLIEGTGSRLDAAGLDLYRRLVTDAAHAAGALRLMAAWDLEPLERALPALALPLTLIAAQGDRTLAPEHAERVQRRVAGARLVKLAGLGHLAHEEDAARVAAAIDGPPPSPREANRPAGAAPRRAAA